MADACREPHGRAEVSAQLGDAGAGLDAVHADPDPDHEGIQKIDRTTVPELEELVALSADLQTALDNGAAT